MLVKQKIDWRNRTNVGFIKRFMGFYESPKEILACSYHCNAAFIGRSDSAIARFSSSTIYLYSVLILLFVFFVEWAALFVPTVFVNIASAQESSVMQALKL